MPPALTIPELYGALRAQVLARHFALGRYFRADLFGNGNFLGVREADAPRGALRCCGDGFRRRPQGDRDPGATARWVIADHHRDNALQVTGIRLAQLAIEFAVGCRPALAPIRRAVDTLERLFVLRGSGSPFEGYVVRYDATACDDWMARVRDGEREEPVQCCSFPTNLGADRAAAPYAYAWPLDDDWYREARRRREANPKGAWDVRRYTRRWEPSFDEVIGLVAGYSVLWDLLHVPGGDPDAAEVAAVRSLVRGQARRLGRYLAHFSYFLVRPAPAAAGLRGDGFCARGPAGLGRAFEHPIAVLLTRITGEPCRSPPNQTPQDVMALAGQGDLARALGGRPRVESLPEVLDAVRGGLQGLFPEVATLPSNDALNEWGARVMRAVFGASAALGSLDTLDMWDEEAKLEVALGVLLDALPPEPRFAALMALPPSGEGDGLPRQCADVFKYLIALACAAAPENEPAVADLRAATSGFCEVVIHQYQLSDRVFDEVHGRYPTLGGLSLRNTSCVAWPLALLLGPPLPPAARAAREEDARALFEGQRDALAGAPQRGLVVCERNGREFEAHDKEDSFGEGFLLGAALSWLYVRREKYPAACRLPPPPTAGELAGWPLARVPGDVVQAARVGLLALPLDGVAAQLPRHIPPLHPGWDLLADDAPRPPGAAALPHCPPGAIKTFRTPEWGVDALEPRPRSFSTSFEFSLDGPAAGGDLARFYDARVERRVVLDKTDQTTVTHHSATLRRTPAGWRLDVAVTLQNWVELSIELRGVKTTPHRARYQAEYAVALVMRPCSRDRAVVYEDIDHAGDWKALLPGPYDSAGLGGLAKKISSLHLPEQMRVTLYEQDGFRGACERFEGDVRDLGAFNDRAASIVVEVGAVAYEHDSFGGGRLFLPIGRYRVGDLGALARKISSLRVPRELRVTLYEGDDCAGRSLVVDGDIERLGDFNDATRSLVVEPR